MMPKATFKRLGQFYLIALGAIALSIIISQFFIQTFISRQSDDSRVINVAGRQRMLSQKISKVSLQIAHATPDKFPRLIEELDAATALWGKSHYGLLHGDSSLELSGSNSVKIQSMYHDISVPFARITANVDTIIQHIKTTSPAVDLTLINEKVEDILAMEKPFLEGMDRIVFQYDNEAKSKVNQLKETEILLFIVSLLIIILELILIFKPLAKQVNETVTELVESETSSKKLANELAKLYEELGKSYQDLEAVNVQPQSPTIFASIHKNGRFAYFSNTLSKLMEYEDDAPPATFQDLLMQAGYPVTFTDELLELVSSGHNWSGEIKLITEPGDFIWLELFAIPVNVNEEIKIIGHDVTELKEAKIRSREINLERIAKSVKEQNYRSVLILEGQEEERKRLSRELHDGVGQMLSAMKLLLESFPPLSKPLQNKMTDAKGLMKSIIQEVRRVSFNLTPSSLDDFGLVPAIKKFCDEINAVAKPEVTFENETKFINRLDGHMETNLYRIVQESVNNALKYAKANHIKVRFFHNLNMLNIEVIDDGRGFDYDRIYKSGHFDKAGHGVFNMRERAAFIGARFQLETDIGKGTKITLTLNME